MSIIRIALMDMNNNHANQGMRNIREITEYFKQHYNGEVEISYFDIRFKNEMPNYQEYDLFISSGGPGNPHREGYDWEDRFGNFLDAIWNHNQTSEDKKYLFLICHSFQIASIHWKLGNICKRKSYSFGVMPIHKTEEGEQDFLLKNLPNPFYAVDSRAYQMIEPNKNNFEKMGAQIVALEKNRPHVHLERAVMAIRFSPEIFGTQFHPEADPFGMLENLKDENNKAAMIKAHGLDKYLETVDRIDDPDKIILTRGEFLPRFLEQAAEEIKKAALTTC